MDEKMTALWQPIHESKKNSLDWFNKARFGMFIHWGLYSIPAGIWKGKKMEEGRGQQGISEWIQHAMFLPRKEYQSLTAEFNPSKFDAAQWVNLVKNAGMKYLVITAKHHDGFALFPSKVSSYNVVDATPFKRDVVGELSNACRDAGIRFGLYYSHSIDWMDGGDGGFKDFSDSSGLNPGFHAYNDWDPAPKSFAAYVRDKGLPQVREILENYENLHAVWYDVQYHMPPGYSWQFYKLTHDLQPSALVSQRIGNGLGDYLVPGDNRIPVGIQRGSKPWETVGTMNNSWGYKSYDIDWKLPQEVLFWVIDIASKGGNYMLNVGPKGDGTLPQENVEILSEVGDWLGVNGEAIYDTGAWNIYHEGPTDIQMSGTHVRRAEGFNSNFTSEDFWFTCRDDTVYAINFSQPTNSEYRIKSFANRHVKSVRLLGSEKPLKWRTTDKTLEVEMPDGKKPELAHVLAVELQS